MYYNLKIIHQDEKTITLAAPCAITGREYSVTVPIRGFNQWRNGDYIQDALSNVSADDREFLISGISPEGWRKIFPACSSGE